MYISQVYFLYVKLPWPPLGRSDGLQVDHAELEGNGCQSFQTRTKAFGLGLPSLSEGQISTAAQSNYIQTHLSQLTVPQQTLIAAAPDDSVCPYMGLEVAEEEEFEITNKDM